MKNLQDITMYGDGELSLNVLNDEFLYKQLRSAARLERFERIVSVVSDMFLYTDEQLEDLRESFDLEVEEINNEVE